MSGNHLVVDARGLLCPWPVLRLSRAVRGLTAPANINVLADDPAAADEIAALCLERGWTFASDAQASASFHVVIP
jgi:tRNA 2-thiouridine synthesizing protein A